MPWAGLELEIPVLGCLIPYVPMLQYSQEASENKYNYVRTVKPAKIEHQK
jgi:hypothetical protein